MPENWYLPASLLVLITLCFSLPCYPSGQVYAGAAWSQNVSASFLTCSLALALFALWLMALTAGWTPLLITCSSWTGPQVPGYLPHCRPQPRCLCTALPQLWIVFPFSSQPMCQWQLRGLERLVLSPPHGVYSQTNYLSPWLRASVWWEIMTETKAAGELCLKSHQRLLWLKHDCSRSMHIAQDYSQQEKSRGAYP